MRLMNGLSTCTNQMVRGGQGGGVSSLTDTCVINCHYGGNGLFLFGGIVVGNRCAHRRFFERERDI